MSITITHTAPGARGLLDRLRAAMAAMAHARQRRRQAAQLYAMSEGELKDLGIGRSEVMHWRDAVSAGAVGSADASRR